MCIYYAEYDIQSAYFSGMFALLSVVFKVTFRRVSIKEHLNFNYFVHEYIIYLILYWIDIPKVQRVDLMNIVFVSTCIVEAILVYSWDYMDLGEYLNLYDWQKPAHDYLHPPI